MIENCAGDNVASGLLVGVVVLSIFTAWCLVSTLWARGKRKQRLGAALLSAVAVVGAALLYSSLANADARQRGFIDFEDRDLAEKRGYGDAISWAKVRDQVKGEIAAEKVAETPQITPANLGSDFATEAKEHACRKDLNCFAERGLAEASNLCKVQVQGLAKWDYEWTDGAAEPAFSRAKWAMQYKGIVTYIGDTLKLQNAFGAWKHVAYTCDYDVDKGAVVSAAVVE